MWISSTNADTVIRNNRMDWLRPESLKDSRLKEGATVVECLLYKAIMDEILDFIYKRKKDYLELKRDMSGAVIALVKSIIDSKIVVEGEKAVLSIDNQELYERLKKKFPKEVKFS